MERVCHTVTPHSLWAVLTILTVADDGYRPLRSINMPRRWQRGTASRRAISRRCFRTFPSLSPATLDSWRRNKQERGPLVGPEKLSEFVSYSTGPGLLIENTICLRIGIRCWRNDHAE